MGARIEPERVAVVGMGNVLTGDDALGPTVIAHLIAGYVPPPGVDFVDAGTPGMDLAILLSPVDAVIIVDSVLGSGPPGTVRSWDRRTIVGRPLAPRTNPHAPGLSETLLSLELLGLGPEAVRLIGVVPEQVEVGTPLSPAVSGAVSTVVERVRTALDGWGVRLQPRDPPARPDLWWQRSPALAPAGSPDRTLEGV